MISFQEIAKRVSKLLNSEHPFDRYPEEKEEIWIGNLEKVQSIVKSANEATDYTGDSYHISRDVTKIVPLNEQAPRLTVELEMAKFGQGEIRPVEIHRERVREGLIMQEEVHCYLLATNGLPQVFFVAPIDEHSYNKWMALVHADKAVREAATNHPRQ